MPAVLLSTISVADPVDVKYTASNYLYVLSGSSASITQYNTNGTPVRSITSIGSNPSGLDVDTNGNVYLAMTGSNQVWRFRLTTSSFVADTNFNGHGYIGSSGTNPGQFDAPYDVAVSPDGNYIYVSDSSNGRIQKFDTNGNYILSIGSAGSGFGQFSSPKGLAFSPNGDLYVADSGNSRIAQVSGDGVVNEVGMFGTFPGQYQSPLNVTASEQYLYVADTSNNRIQKLDIEDFTPVMVVSTPFGFNQPASVTIANDSAQEMMYAADTANNRVLLIAIPKVDPTITWNTAKSNLVSGNIEAALTQFSTTSIDNFRAMFNSVPSATLSSNMTAIGTITPLDVDDDEAHYYFTTTFGGKLFAFIITFENENGSWKIRNF